MIPLLLPLSFFFLLLLVSFITCYACRFHHYITTSQFSFTKSQPHLSLLQNSQTAEVGRKRLNGTVWVLVVSDLVKKITYERRRPLWRFLHARCSYTPRISNRNSQQTPCTLLFFFSCSIVLFALLFLLLQLRLEFLI